MQPSADEDNDDVIESFWLYTLSVFPSFVDYYLDRYQVRSNIIFILKEDSFIQFFLHQCNLT